MHALTEISRKSLSTNNFGRMFARFLAKFVETVDARDVGVMTTP
ncbi:hypothetical protein AciX9_0123 [Granulicella tundricola MP5ACTX9]|uniref:Uncharacterized protein n=1 Tax=Granulicella tundricola (strain ATCC BAA-1859 / DSM 23138 / MP5ACTX9) TaxID=1198114 RepID=E8X508_GRATM|nr:hypothetical protein AciX9_0123 [Granulicella tundricola MP5ACTX9]